MNADAAGLVDRAPVGGAVEPEAVAEVVYLVPTPATPRNRERWGVALMRTRGIQVTVLDLSDIVMPHLDHDRSSYDAVDGFALRAPGDMAALEAELPTLRRAGLVVCLVQSSGVSRANLPVLRLLTRAGTPYLIWNGPVVPGWRRNTFVERNRRKLRGIVAALGSKDLASSLIRRLPIRFLGVAPADYVLESSPGVNRPNRLVGPRTRVIRGHAPDYEAFIRQRDAAPAVKSQAVFIDQFLPFHHDFVDSGTRSVDSNDYYRSLRSFFDRVESELGLEIVVAAHPRADYPADGRVFGGRRIVTGETARLVLESRLVLAHASSAVGFAVMAGKPIILLTSRAHDAVGIEGVLCREFADALGAPLLFIDDDRPVDFQRLMAVDHEKYDSYLRTYVKTPGTPDVGLWDLVLDAVGAAAGWRGA